MRITPTFAALSDAFRRPTTIVEQLNRAIGSGNTLPVITGGYKTPNDRKSEKSSQATTLKASNQKPVFPPNVPPIIT